MKRKRTSDDETDTEAETVSETTIMRNSFLADKKNKIIQNLVMSKPSWMFENHELHRVKLDKVVPHEVKPRINITDQKQTGRCWMYGTLHPAAVLTSKKYKLGRNFFFSTAHLFFYHKLESIISLLKYLISVEELDLDDDEHDYLIHCQAHEGGYSNHLRNLVEKYGLIPANQYRDVEHTENTRSLNKALKLKLNAVRAELLRLPRSRRESYVNTVKQEFYNILCYYLGTPPAKVTFRFKNPKTKSDKTITVTPLEFYRDYVPYDFAEEIYFINDPTKKYDQLYRQHPYKTNVHGKELVYWNKDISAISNYIKKSINKGFTVPFACDIRKNYHYNGLLDEDNFKEQNEFLNIKKISKLERLKYRYGHSTHLMAIVGYDSDRKLFKVANSWGNDYGLSGYILMTEEWFAEHTYKIVINKSLLTRADAKLLETSEDITDLELSDIF